MGLCDVNFPCNSGLNTGQDIDQKTKTIYLINHYETSVHYVCSEMVSMSVTERLI